MNRPPSLLRNDDSDVIDLVPASAYRGGFASRLARWSAVAVAVGAGLVVLVVVLRLIAMVVLRGTITQTTEDIARIGGADTYLTGWLTSVLPFLLALVYLGLAVRIGLAFLFPGLGGLKIVKTALLAGGLTLGSALVPGTMMSLRQVGADGLPAVMVEVDPAKERWFDRDGVAKIYYADHLDGTRRFWNAPGHTPFDGSVAKPVTQEESMRFQQEQTRRQIDEELRRLHEEAEQARLQTEEARRAEAAAVADSLRIADPPGAATTRPPSNDPPGASERSAPAAPKELSVDEAIALFELRDAPVPSTPPPAPAPMPDHRLELLPGRTLELRLNRRAAEIRTDGTVELTRPGYNGTIVLGSDSPRVFSESETIRVRVIGRRGVVLHLRWLDARPDRGLPMATYHGSASMPGSPPPAPRPAPRAAAVPAAAPAAVQAPPPAAPPAQRFPLPLGEVLRLEIGGDTVEVWSDGPFHLAAGANGAVSEVRSGQRMRISGADFFVASPSAPETRWLHVQTVAPSPRRVAPEVSAPARR